MQTAELNNKMFEVVFKSTGSNVIQTHSSNGILIHTKVSEESPWCKIDNIGIGDKITILDIEKDLYIKLSATKLFEYIVK